MAGYTIHDRAVRSCGLALGLAGWLAAAAPALGQPDIPVFEARHELRYRFPEEHIEIAPAAFRTTIRGSETILRDTRETVMQYDGSLGFTLASRPLTSSGDLPEGTVDLYARLTEVRLQCRAGRGSYSILAGEDGLVENRPLVGETRLGPHEKYIGSHTVASLLAKPSTIRFANGALLEAPAPAGLLATLDCAWMYSGVSAILPPLPSRPITTGQTWKAGMPIRLSVFGQPQIIRLDFRFEEFDEETHVAVIGWNTTLASTSVVAVAGIHHIGPDAVASGTVSGRLRLHADSGTVLSSEMRVNVKISHLRSSGTTVQYAKVYSLENLAASGPSGSIAAARPEGEDEP